MKRRLRKKKHLGEFAVYGCEIVIHRSQEIGFDFFLDDLITIVESQNCSCGGSGRGDYFDGVIELGHFHQDLGSKAEYILEAVKNMNCVESVVFGKEFDLWYGEPESIIKRGFDSEDVWIKH